MVGHEFPVAVLWDMDGTLIDSEPEWISAQERLVAEHSGVWTFADGLALVGTDMAVTAVALQTAGVLLPAAEIIERLTAEVTAALGRSVDWRPGARELVAELCASAVPQAIVTTSPRSMAEVVAAALPAGSIQVIVAGEDVRNGKPHPEPYLLAARRLGVAPSECVAIEDSPTGLSAAIAAGTTAIGVPHDTTLDHSGRWTRVDSLSGMSLPDLARIAGANTAATGP
jgi:HAD superfamily hydrolase (TIGR01509 family)